MTVQATQRAEDLSPEATREFIKSVRSALYAHPGKNAAFREWVLRSLPGDKRPRGQYFKGKARPVPFVMDEAWHLSAK
jgi:hypothetical protein